MQLIPKEIFDKFNFSGEVLHVGAHLGEEAEFYEKLGFSKVWWIEGNPNIIPRLVQQVKKYKIKGEVIRAAIADGVMSAQFHVTNNSYSSSILDLGEHKTQYPEVKYVDNIPVETTTINLLNKKHDFSGVKLMTLDIQGAELMALHGATDILPTVDFIHTEVNIKEMYVGCGLIQEVTDFLNKWNFKLHHKVVKRFGWGDALYVKEKVI